MRSALTVTPDRRPQEADDGAATRHRAVAQAIDRFDPALVAYLPSNTIAPIIEALRGQDRAGRRTFPVAREEEAVGLIGAAAMGGARGSILIQDNGFGNSLTALATFGVAYHIPVPLVANIRGGAGEYNSMIHTFSNHVPKLLQALNIPVWHLDRRLGAGDWEETVLEAHRHAWMTHRPVAVLLDLWDPLAEKGQR